MSAARCTCGSDACTFRLARGLRAFCDATLRAESKPRELPGYATEAEAREAANGRAVVRRAASTVHSGGPRTMRWFVR